MYAQHLMRLLHDRLSRWNSFDQTQERFERLRGYNLLPRGRENAGVRLSNEQIASAVLGFAHPLPGFAGHASLILGGLRPVGGTAASFRGASNLNEAVSELISGNNQHAELRRLNLAIEHDFADEDYKAVLYFKTESGIKAVSFVSKYALRLSIVGAEVGYDHEQLDKLTAIERSLNARFFRDLAEEVSISRVWNRPLKTEWTEYTKEEEIADFHRRLGSRPSSTFLNLRVETQVAWPREPVRMEFGGHYFVLFPRTKDNACSISIDLTYERISADEARSLINRMLSIMSWCDDQPASLHDGWSGNPVPVPVPVSRHDSGGSTLHEWHFNRRLPNDERLMRCLAYYRDGLNAASVGLVSHAVLSFFRVFETRYSDRQKVINWINVAFSDVRAKILDDRLQVFDADRQAAGVDVGTYIYRNCRVATAHAAKDVPSDPDEAGEIARLFNASEIIQKLARHFVHQEYSFSRSYFTDESAK